LFTVFAALLEVSLSEACRKIIHPCFIELGKGYEMCPAPVVKAGE
jgi:hypothetical protein